MGKPTNSGTSSPGRMKSTALSRMNNPKARLLPGARANSGSQVPCRGVSCREGVGRGPPQRGTGGCWRTLIPVQIIPRTQVANSGHGSAAVGSKNLSLGVRWGARNQRFVGVFNESGLRQANEHAQRAERHTEQVEQRAEQDPQ